MLAELLLVLLSSSGGPNTALHSNSNQKRTALSLTTAQVCVEQCLKGHDIKWGVVAWAKWMPWGSCYDMSMAATGPLSMQTINR